MGWLPSYPTLNRNPLDICEEAERRRRPAADHVIDELKGGGLRFAAEDPDDPANFPRVLTLWRANLLGSSAKGHEYFLRHLLGVEQNSVDRERDRPRACARPRSSGATRRRRASSTCSPRSTSG